MRCRLCLYENRTFLTRVTFNVVELVEKHLRLKIFDDGNLFICPNCRNHLKRFDNFYEVVHQMQRILEQQSIKSNNATAQPQQSTTEAAPKILLNRNARNAPRTRPEIPNLTNVEYFEVNELQKETEKLTSAVQQPTSMPNQLLNVDIFEINEIAEYAEKESPVQPILMAPITKTNTQETFEIIEIKDEPQTSSEPVVSQNETLNMVKVNEIKTENDETSTTHTASLEEPKEKPATMEDLPKLNETETDLLANIKCEIEEEEFVPVATCIDAQPLEKLDCSNDDDDEVEKETNDSATKIKVRNEALTKEEEELEKMLEQQRKPQKRKRAKRNTAEYRMGDKIIAENIELKCYRCNDNVTFKLFNELKAHYRQQHEGMEGYITCCERNIYNRTELLDHIKYHSDPEIYRCSVCDKKFQSRKYMNSHLLREHKNDQGWKYNCTICNKGFPWLSSLRTHMDVHKKEKSHVCDDCGKSFSGQYRLRSHIRLVHTKAYTPPKNIECKLCGAIIGSRTSFARHMKKHMTKQTTDDNEKDANVIASAYKCNYCPKSFKSVTLCKSHIIAMHMLQCVFCLSGAVMR